MTHAERTARILVVDDEPDLRTLYELTLLREGYEVESADSLRQAWQCLAASRFDAVITDMRLPDGLGLEIVTAMTQQQRPERCVMITAYGSAENAVEALKAGAFDYLTKPVDLRQFRAVVVSAVHSTREAQAGRTPPPTAPAAQRNTPAAPGPRALARLIGESGAMRSVRARIARVAASMAPVLVLGESGTGKELVARAIHDCSHRSEGPFVAVNCGAIPESLLEAEFFGARKGSYTGSVADREGYFQAAAGGTLFLDEIGDLPLAMQSKLLRAIQERRVRALGSTQEESVDVRIVSATHKDLAALVHGGEFRQDLYYRLNVIDIVVPPLRERRDDLPALCDALLGRIAAEAALPVPSFDQSLIAALSELPLAGNVRELENLLHRALALHDGGPLQLDLPSGTPWAVSNAESRSAPPAPSNETQVPKAMAGEPAELPTDLQAWLDLQEREVLVRALRETGFNRTAAAARLGLNLRQIRYRMARLNITPPGSQGLVDEDDGA